MALAVDRAVKPQHKQTLFELLPLLQLVPFTTSPALPSINQMQIQWCGHMGSYITESHDLWEILRV